MPAQQLEPFLAQRRHGETTKHASTPHTTVHVYVCMTPAGSIVHGRYFHHWNSVGAKRSALERSRRQLSEDVPFGVGTGTLLVVEQSSLETRLRYITVMYGSLGLGLGLVAAVSRSRRQSQHRERK